MDGAMFPSWRGATWIDCGFRASLAVAISGVVLIILRALSAFGPTGSPGHVGTTWAGKVAVVCGLVCAFVLACFRKKKEEQQAPEREPKISALFPLEERTEAAEPQTQIPLIPSLKDRGSEAQEMASFAWKPAFTPPDFCAQAIAYTRAQVEAQLDEPIEQWAARAADLCAQKKGHLERLLQEYSSEPLEKLEVASAIKELLSVLYTCYHTCPPGVEKDGWKERLEEEYQSLLKKGLRNSDMKCSPLAHAKHLYDRMQMHEAYVPLDFRN